MIDLNLLLNKPIFIKKGLYIIQPTLNEISILENEKIKIGNNMMGYELYDMYITIFTSYIDKIRGTEQYGDFTDYDFIRLFIKEDEDIRNCIYSCLEILFKTNNIKYNYKSNLLEIDDIEIILEDFIKIQNIIKLANYIEASEKEDKYKPANDKAQSIKDKIKKSNKKIEEIKNNKDTNFADIVSYVGARSRNTSLVDIGNLSIYQIMNQYKRTQVIDKLDLQQKLLLGGSEIKETENVLQHF